jgi:UDP-glucose 4-epimerase
LIRSLVTGGGGFIGSHVARRLVGAGHRVVVLDDLSSGSWDRLADLGGAVERVRGDIRDEAVLGRVLRGVRFVFHHAALVSVARSLDDPWSTHELNAGGTLRVLLAARAAGVQRVVYAASSAVYGNEPGLPKTEDMPARPASPYAAAKYAGELYAEAVHRGGGLETVSLRYFNVYGPGQDPGSPYAAVVPRFAHALLGGEPPLIFGDGRQSRDFVYVEDVAAANLAAAEAPIRRAGGRSFNIGSGRRTTVLALLREMQAVTGRRVAPRHAPARPGEVRRSQADVAAARQALGWTPTTGLREGLARTVAWMASGGPAAGGGPAARI